MWHPLFPGITWISQFRLHIPSCPPPCPPGHCVAYTKPASRSPSHLHQPTGAQAKSFIMLIPLCHPTPTHLPLSPPHYRQVCPLDGCHLALPPSLQFPQLDMSSPVSAFDLPIPSPAASGLQHRRWIFPVPSLQGPRSA